MRHLLVAMLLATPLAVPGAGFATSSSSLPYDLNLASPLGPAPKIDKVLSGSTFGGVPVTGTVTGTATSGTLNLVVDGRVFVSGTYSCSSSCTFTGTVAGKTVTGMTLGTSKSLGGKSTLAAIGTAASSAFPNHGAWVSTVSHWANANLNGRQKGQVVSAAAKIEGPLASGKNAPRQSGSQAGGQSAGRSTGQSTGQGSHDQATPQNNGGNGDAGSDNGGGRGHDHDNGGGGGGEGHGRS